MARSLKKGPFIDHHLKKKIDVQNQDGSKKTDQNMVETIDDHP
jgi:ribosomal protein S19